MAQVNARARPNRASSPRSRLERSRTDRLIGGVAGGIGRHLGIHPNIVRVAFVGLSFAAGFGVVVYLLTWLLAPLEAATVGVEPPARRIRAPTWRQAIGIGLVAVGLLVVVSITGLWFGGEHGWPVALAAIGFAILWARSGDDGRGRSTLSRLGSPLGSAVAGPDRCRASPSARCSSWAAWGSSSRRTPRSRRRATCCWR